MLILFLILIVAFSKLLILINWSEILQLPITGFIIVADFCVVVLNFRKTHNPLPSYDWCRFV